MSSPDPKFYTLQNGSKIEIGDVDEADRIVSTQFDACWVEDDSLMRLRSYLNLHAYLGHDDTISHIEHDSGGTRLHCSDIRAVLELVDEIAELKAKVEALEAACRRCADDIKSATADWSDRKFNMRDRGGEGLFNRMTHAEYRLRVALEERGKQEGADA